MSLACGIDSKLRKVKSLLLHFFNLPFDIFQSEEVESTLIRSPTCQLSESRCRESKVNLACNDQNRRKCSLEKMCYNEDECKECALKIECPINNVKILDEEKITFRIDKLFDEENGENRCEENCKRKSAKFRCRRQFCYVKHEIDRQKGVVSCSVFRGCQKHH